MKINDDMEIAGVVRATRIDGELSDGCKAQIIECANSGAAERDARLAELILRVDELQERVADLAGIVAELGENINKTIIL